MADIKDTKMTTSSYVSNEKYRGIACEECKTMAPFLKKSGERYLCRKCLEKTAAAK